VPLVTSRAIAGRDDEDFAAFECWDGDPTAYWSEEVENYVRGSVLRHAHYVLAFRDGDGKLAAVSAFDSRVIQVPLVAPSSHPTWHLQVIAVRLDLQGHHVADQVFAETFRAMRDEDKNRDIVTGNVHRANAPSRHACARHGLDSFLPLDADYDIVLGEIPP
jgi:hypothetical protein